MFTAKIMDVLVLNITVENCLPSLFMGVVNPIPFPSKKLKAWFFLFFLFGEVLEEKKEKEKVSRRQVKGAGSHVIMSRQKVH